MRYRIYYNRAQDPPWIWSYDEGTQATEKLVCGWRLHGVDVRDGSDFAVERGSETAPRVWMDVQADLVQVIDGVAHFYGRWVGSGWPLAGE